MYKPIKKEWLSKNAYERIRLIIIYIVSYFRFSEIEVKQLICRIQPTLGPQVQTHHFQPRQPCMQRQLYAVVQALSDTYCS